ncbi:minor capsid protein [Heliobacterium chlorum]|uniref:Minor capsid protein n=1 Tax=Heliobacterium chlorum TaxID=2698 RepID=A0ABR7T686_HELCL|nr:phage minor capsid protein [Heliobacterium chlorum]MBC9786284.1 minor capsid protein [Heliobacterium chlorum]
MTPIPKPVYERDIQRLIGYYQKAFTEIAGRLKTIPSSGGLENAYAESLLSQIMVILRDLDGSTKSWCEQVINQAFTGAQAQTILSLGDASSLSEAASSISFSMLARERTEGLINDTYTDLLMATQNTERKIKQLVRNAVSETLRVKALEQMGRRTMKGAIINDLTHKGLSAKLNSDAWVGIVDRAGRRWNLSTYAEMVVRTKLTQAHIEGTRVETLERNVDLAVISSHGAKDACRAFEGIVISLHGLTPGYHSYDQVRSTGMIFHPNCKHHVSPVRDIDLLPKRLREKHDQKMKALRM